MIVAWPCRAYTLSAPSMVPSQVIGELALIRPIVTAFSATKSSPNTSLAIAIVSSARSGEVTEPMKALSE
jgi:hypothetical protein